MGQINTSCNVIAVILTTSLYMAQKKYRTPLGFKKFPVCKCCGSVWKFENCVEGLSIYKRARLCPYKSPFSKSHHRQRCNGVLCIKNS